MRGGNKFVV